MEIISREKRSQIIRLAIFSSSYKDKLVYNQKFIFGGFYEKSQTFFHHFIFFEYNATENEREIFCF